MEKTLIIFKPDCIDNKNTGKVLQRFEHEGFEICACKMVKLSNDILNEHYAHLHEVPNFEAIKAFMGKRPVIIMVLEAENAVDRMRALIGPTDSQKAEKGTIRGDMGTDKMRNVVHASDSRDNATKEINRFFSRDELFS